MNIKNLINNSIYKFFLPTEPKPKTEKRVAMRLFSTSRFLRNKVNTVWMKVMLILIVLLPFAIGFGLFMKSSVLLKEQNLGGILFSSNWRPMAKSFGFLPFIVSSFYVTILSLVIAGPICIFTAIYLTQYASERFLRIMRPLIDILAGIPSVIYGVWGILIIVPLISKHIGPLMGTQTSGYTILAASLVLAIMIIPFILNITIEVFRTIPIELTEAALSLGTTRWETIKHVLMRKGFAGIVSALGLGVSRAFGETIAVLMVAGNFTKMPKGLLQPGYPLPALIANNYGEMLSIPQYDSALMFAALVLFIVVILFNLASRITIARLELAN